MWAMTSGVMGTSTKWLAVIIDWLWIAKKEQVPVPLGSCPTPMATMVRGTIELELSRLVT